MSPVPLGAVTCISQAVVEAYTGAHTVNVGNFASALIIHCNNRVQAVPSVPADTTIAAITGQAVAEASASIISRLLSATAKYTRSQNACVYQAVQVTVVPVHLPSALQAGSNAIPVFSANVIVPPVVNAEGVVSVGEVSVLFVRVLVDVGVTTSVQLATQAVVAVRA